MVKILIRKPFINKNNGQRTITIPKKSLPKGLRYCPDLMFAIAPFREAERSK